MLRALTLAAGLAACLAGAARPVAVGGAEEAFVSLVDENRLVGVMLDTGEVTARIPVAPGPEEVAVSRDRRWLLVASPPAGAVTLVDSYGQRAVHVFRGLRSPSDVAFARDGRRAYVAEEGGDSVAVLDLTKRRQRARIPVGPEPHDLAVGPNGRWLWVADRHGVGIVDLRTGRLAGRGGTPSAEDLVFDGSGLFVWVTYRSSGIVGEVRAYPRTGRLRLQQLVGRLVRKLELDAAGHVWATDEARGEAIRLDGSGHAVWRQRGCPGAQDVAVGPGRGRVVVACAQAGTLLVWDPAERRVARIQVGRGPRAAVAFVP